jgi:DNA polymerase I-like protein with 3'-5' exonuclease and polymerase domains
VRLALVGEAWGADEERERRPFVGAAGQVLDRLLRGAGIDRASCLVTNVVNARPPGNEIDKWIVFTKKAVPDYRFYRGAWCNPLVVLGIETLRNEIAEFRPDKIVAFGNTPLWALTEQRGIGNWRGSELDFGGVPLIPTYHPAALLRQADLQFEVKHDLKARVLKASHTRPAWRFGIGLSLANLHSALERLPEAVAVDIETSRHTIISIAFASSPVDAFTIAFVGGDGAPSFSPAEEQKLRGAIHAALSRRRVIGQNWHYDRWYINECWGFDVPAAFDTMVAQHVLMPGKPKDLAYLSSLYCEHHIYWKDELKDWKETRVDETLARYNCEDAARTFEVAAAQRAQLAKRALTAQFEERMRFADSCHRMSRRGVPVHIENRLAITTEVEAEIEALQERVNGLAGCDLNVRSNPTVARVLYEERGLPRIFHRKTGHSTANDEALLALAKKYVEHAPLCEGIVRLRTLKSLRSGFLSMLPDLDGRARTSFNAAGPETYRLSSSENPWGGGTNFQNITAGAPNLRRCFAPDPGYTIAEADLQRADLQVVVWEAGDEDLKAKLRAGADIHTENAKEIFRVVTPGRDERQKAKQFVHLTNYGGLARTCAITLGITVREAEAAQARWFGLHPAIRRWHTRVQAELAGRKKVVNAFGFARTWYGRIDHAAFKEALGWIGQSTVACAITRAQLQFERELYEIFTPADVSLLLQVHDSLVFQYRTDIEATILPEIHEVLLVPIPFADPLVIDYDLKTSTVSWGDAVKREW